MGTIVDYQTVQQYRQSRRLEALLADARRLTATCKQAGSQLEDLRMGLQVLVEGLADTHRTSDWTLAFCRRAEAAYRTDGSVDEAAYLRLKQDYADRLFAGRHGSDD